MAKLQTPPELDAAIKKGALVDGVMLAVGVALWLGTGEIAWLVGCFVIGSTAFVLLLAQAGAFTRNHERR